MSVPAFVSRAGLEILIGEIVWSWTPMLLFAADVNLYRKRTQPRPRA